jgi:dipeptidyl aminopeptidase/acylaminoacyl peptidase
VEDINARDIRSTDVYRRARALHERLRQPGTGLISDAAELSVSGKHAVFAGTIMDELRGPVPTRICLLDLDSAETRVLTFGPNTDRLPKFSPDGRRIAFLSDRRGEGDFQLYLLDPATGAARPTPPVQGWVEYLHWSPDGTRILLGVAGHGADVSGGQGAVTSQQQRSSDTPSWLPAVTTGDESYRWRRAWIYDVSADRVFEVGDPGLNIWEAVWCGNRRLAAVVSPGPGEGLWYSATLNLLDIEGGNSVEIFKPRHQIGWPAASPSGRHVAIAEAICSDRWLVAGELHVIDTESRQVSRVDTGGGDITCTEWRSDRLLLVAGHRGFETVVGTYDPADRGFSQRWSSQELTSGGRFVTVAGVGEAGDCALVGESFTRAPEIAIIRAGRYRPVRSFDLGYAREMELSAVVEPVTWAAPDGQDIQGWLLRPKRAAPHPLVLYVHGGPVSHWRPVWLARKLAPVMLLLQQGCAVFLPNPRGSAGRGIDFARAVRGDLGGIDARDLLSGVDALVAQGVADRSRLGVMGGSYGGFMTSWLITQDPRFAAAVSIVPHTNQVTERLLSNIPHFVDLFLEDHYYNAGGKYFERSPIMHAHKTKTPTLNICGALDRCTPAEEAMQFHSALLEHGVESVLVVYPEEGHGVRKFPAAVDYAARIAAWFAEHMPAQNSSRSPRF